MIQLLCPLCVAQGKMEPVKTSIDSAWVPALLEKYIPEDKRKEGFITLEEAIEKAPQFEALVETNGKRRKAKTVCFVDSQILRAAKIWTDKYSTVMERKARAAAKIAAERAEEQAERERKAFNSIGSILSGKKLAAVSAAESQGEEPEIDDAGAQARAEQEEVQRKLAADARANAAAAEAEEAVEADGEQPAPKGKGRKPAGKGRKAQAKGSTKGRSQGKLRGEIDAALAGNEPPED
jgi:hypothetical protein